MVGALEGHAFIARRFQQPLLLQGGVRAALPYLERRAAAASSDAELQAALAEAHRVVEAWERQIHNESEGIAHLKVRG